MSAIRFENEAREELLSSINDYLDKHPYLDIEELLEEEFGIDISINQLNDLSFGKLQLIANCLDGRSDIVDDYDNDSFDDPNFFDSIFDSIFDSATDPFFDPFYMVL